MTRQKHDLQADQSTQDAPSAAIPSAAHVASARSSEFASGVPTAHARPRVRQRRGVVWGLHCALWLMLMPVSAGYLAAVAIAPDATRTAIAQATGLGADQAALVVVRAEQSEDGLRSPDMSAGELKTAIRGEPGDDISKLKRELAEARARAAALEAEKIARARDGASAASANTAADAAAETPSADDAGGSEMPRVAGVDPSVPVQITTGSLPTSVGETPIVRDVKVTTVPITGANTRAKKLPPLPPRVPKDLRQTASAALAVQGIEILNQNGASAIREQPAAPNATLRRDSTAAAGAAAGQLADPLRRRNGASTGRAIAEQIGKPERSETIAFGPGSVLESGGPITQTPEAGVGIQLSSGPSVDSLRLSWVFLQDAHASVLAGLKPKFRADDAGNAGAVYRLLAGPMISRREADQVCSLLRAKSVPCNIASYDGAPLPMN